MRLSTLWWRLTRGEWFEAGPLAAIPAGGSLRFEVGGLVVLVFRRADSVFAFEERCPHAAGRIASDLTATGFVVCPAHGYSFDLATGRCRTMRSVEATTFRTRIVEGRVWVRVGRRATRAQRRAADGGSPPSSR